MSGNGIIANEVCRKVVATAYKESKSGFLAVLLADASMRTINGAKSANASKARSYFEGAFLEDGQEGKPRVALDPERPLFAIGNAFLHKAIFEVRRNVLTEPAVRSYLAIARIAYWKHLIHRPDDEVARHNLSIAEDFSGKGLLEGRLQ